MNKDKIIEFLRNRRNQVIIGVSAVVAIGAIAGGVYYFNHNKTEDTVTEQTDKVTENKLLIVIEDGKLQLLDSEDSELGNSENYEELYDTISEYFDKNFSFYWKQDSADVILLSVEKNSTDDFVFSNGVEILALVSRTSPTTFPSESKAEGELVTEPAEETTTAPTDTNSQPTENNNTNVVSANNNTGNSNSGNRGNSGGGSNSKPAPAPSKPAPAPAPAPAPSKPAPAPAPAPAPTQRTWKYRDDFSQQTFALINEYRASFGLPAIQHTAAKQQEANARAAYNAEHDTADHDNAQLSIRGNIFTTPQQFLDAWKGSGVHNGYLKNKDLRIGAVSVYEDSRGYFYVIAALDANY